MQFFIHKNSRWWNVKQFLFSPLNSGKSNPIWLTHIYHIFSDRLKFNKPPTRNPCSKKKVTSLSFFRAEVSAISTQTGGSRQDGCSVPVTTTNVAPVLWMWLKLKIWECQVGVLLGWRNSMEFVFFWCIFLRILGSHGIDTSPSNHHHLGEYVLELFPGILNANPRFHR